MKNFYLMSAVLFTMASIAWFVVAFITPGAVALQIAVGVVFGALAIVYWTLHKRQTSDAMSGGSD